MRYLSKISLAILLIFIGNSVFSQVKSGNRDVDKVLDVSICHGEDYINNAFVYIQPEVGHFVDTAVYTNVHGGDSIVVLNLTVNPGYEKVLWESICYGEDYTDNGFNVIAPPVGWNYDTLFFTSQGGCDSIVVLDLMVYPVYDTLITAYITIGGDYTENGFNILQPKIGIHTASQALQSMYGCDSLVSLKLYVMPEPATYLTDTVCQGVDYLLEGFVILHGQPAGTMIDSLKLKNIYGGDSTVYLTLTVLPEYETIYNESICYGADYIEHGFTYLHPAPGEYHDYIRYETTKGCDSTFRLNLVVHPIIDSLVVASICYGEDYLDNEFFIPQPEVGKVYDTVLVSNADGCTMFYLDLTVNPVFDTLIFDTICYGNIYTKNGFYIESLPVGPHSDSLVLQTQLGCDSTVRLQLMVNPVFETQIVDAICFGDIYDQNGFYFDDLPVGLHYDTLVLQNQYNCDSTILLQLSVNPVYDTLILDTICFGEIYTQNGFYLDSLGVGVYRDTLFLQSQFECDSVVKLRLTVMPVYNTHFVESICYGESYIENGFEYIEPAVGTYSDSLLLQSQYGCDSIVYLNLTVNPVHDTYLNPVLCYGESYVQNGFNIVRPQVGILFDTLSLESHFGCDSTVYLRLTVNPVNDTLFTEHICYGEDYIGHGFIVNNPSPGVHNQVLNLVNQYGCDSIVRLSLTVYNTYNIRLVESICEGESYVENGFSIITPEVGVVNDTLNLSSIHGCDSIVMLNLTILPVFDFGPSQIQGYKETYASTNLQTGRYEYVIDPVEHCNDYRWTIIGSDKWVVEPHGNECVLYVTTAGECILQVAAENVCSPDNKRQITINGHFYDVEEVTMIEADVYPNPAKDKIVVESEEITGIKIISLYGQTVWKGQYSDENKVFIDVDNLPRGSYLVLVETKLGNIYKQVVIDR